MYGIYCTQACEIKAYENLFRGLFGQIYEICTNEKFPLYGVALSNALQAKVLTRIIELAASSAILWRSVKLYQWSVN